MPAPVLAVLIVTMSGPVKAATPMSVFILAGQSNMMSPENGDTLPASFKKVQEGVFYNFWLSTRDWALESPTWLPMQLQRNKFGSELTFVQAIVDSIPGSTVGIIKVSYSGTSLRTAWNPSNTKEPLMYQTMIAKVHESLSDLVQDGYEPKLEALVWIQGEGDASLESMADFYGDRLANLMENLRGDVATPELPIIYNRLHSQANREFRDLLRQRQGEFAETDAHALMVDIDDLPLKDDSIHFQSVTHLAVGQRMTTAYLQNLGHPVTLRSIPVPGSAAILTVAGVSLAQRRW